MCMEGLCALCVWYAKSAKNLREGGGGGLVNWFKEEEEEEKKPEQEPRTEKKDREKSSV